MPHLLVSVIIFMKEVTALETEMGKPFTAGKTALPNGTIKDSVFRDIFSHSEYLLELYKVIHPEDTTATEADLGNVTIRNVLMVICTMIWDSPSGTGSF